VNAEAVPVGSASAIARYITPDTAVVGIDEAQFHIVATAEALASCGIRVVAAGLDQDWKGVPFGPMPALMAVAEYVTKLHAVSTRCGAAATRSQRLVAAEGQLFGGGAAEYEARCRACFLPGADSP
jgi:thymidine kinase